MSEKSNKKKKKTFSHTVKGKLTANQMEMFHRQDADGVL